MSLAKLDLDQKITTNEGVHFLLENLIGTHHDLGFSTDQEV